MLRAKKIRYCLNENCNNILTNQKGYCSRICLYTCKKWRRKIRKKILNNPKFGIRKCTCCEKDFRPVNYKNRVCKKCSKKSNKKSYARTLRYGISHIQIKQLIKKQKGKCALCTNKPKCVDHNHETGQTRGMLCFGCNSALNRVEVQGWAIKALKYLKKYEKVKSKYFKNLEIIKNKSILRKVNGIYK